MTNHELKTTLQHIKNERRGGAPHDAWVSRNRDILLMQARNTTDATAKLSAKEAMNHLFGIFFPAEMFAGMAHAVGVFALVVGTVFGGGLASAQVYQNAIPGEVMYKVKLAVESTQLLLAPNDDYRTRLHADFADHRIDEIAALAEGSPTAQALVPASLAKFDAEVNALAAGLNAVKDSSDPSVVETAKLLERKMAVYQSMLRTASATLPGSGRLAVASSRDLVDGVTIQAIAVIVEKHLAGSADAPASVVASKVGERLKLAEDKLDATPASEDTAVAEKKTKAKAAIADAKALLKEEQYQAALSKIVEVAELTKEVDGETVTAETEPAPAPSDATKPESTPAATDKPADTAPAATPPPAP